MASERLDVILQLITGNYKREAREAALATGQIGTAAKTSSGQLGILGQNTTTVGNKLRGFATGALLAAGAGMVRLGVESVKAASDLAESMNAVNVVFGTAAKTITDFGEEAAESAGLAQSEFQQMASVLGSALINAGIPLDEAADKTIELTQRAADMASVFNTSVPDALGAMQSALRGETDPIEKFGVTLSAAAVDAEAAALGFEKVGGQWTAQAKAAARLSLIMSQTNRVAGDFANTSDGLANKSKILSARFEDLKADIGTGLIPIVLDAIDAIEPLLDAFGFLADKLKEVDDAVNEGRESPSRWAQSWAVATDVGKGAIFGMVGVLGRLFDEENALRDNTVTTTGEIHDSWMNLIPTSEAIASAVQTTATAHQNAATAASNQRDALINLFNAQAALLDPVGKVLTLQQDAADAQERLTELQEDAETPARDLALAIIEVETANLRLAAATGELSAEQIAEFARVLTDEMGFSEDQALDLLETLGLFDGLEVNAKVKVTMETVASGGGGVNPFNDLVGFASGGVVPGWQGQPQLIVAHGGEMITPAGATTNSNSRTQVFHFAAPVKPVDLQWISLQNNLETLVS